MTDFELTETDRLLMTTKQVRKRLDLTKEVPIKTVLECIEVASRAPIGGNAQVNRWMLVNDPKTKEALADLYRREGTAYLENGKKQVEELGGDATQRAVVDSSLYLLDHLHEVPMMIIPIRNDRPGTSVFDQATFWGSVTPGVWSLQLALRARGIGSAWTTLHLYHEHEASNLLGIPESVTQIALLPTAYYTGSHVSQCWFVLSYLVDSMGIEATQEDLSDNLASFFTEALIEHPPAEAMHSPRLGTKKR